MRYKMLEVGSAILPQCSTTRICSCRKVSLCRYGYLWSNHIFKFGVKEYNTILIVQ